MVFFPPHHFNMLFSRCSFEQVPEYGIGLGGMQLGGAEGTRKPSSRLIDGIVQTIVNVLGDALWRNRPVYASSFKALIICSGWLTYVVSHSLWVR